PADAVLQYKTLESLLRTELGIAPSAETEALLESVRQASDAPAEPVVRPGNSAIEAAEGSSGGGGIVESSLDAADDSQATAADPRMLEIPPDGPRILDARLANSRNRILAGLAALLTVP